MLDEADVVSQLLETALPGKLTLLDDRRREIDLVRVQNELFGDHQVLHIASHGVYTEGQPDATGAILSSECLLTTDMVRQLRFVPDVVFLNCCSLGRTGTNRLAAGLAREFMAIGVRALVAAAWPIDDAAARRSPRRSTRVDRRTHARRHRHSRPQLVLLSSVDARRGPRTSATATRDSCCAAPRRH